MDTVSAVTHSVKHISKCKKLLYEAASVLAMQGFAVPVASCGEHVALGIDVCQQGPVHA